MAVPNFDIEWQSLIGGQTQAQIQSWIHDNTELQQLIGYSDFAELGGMGMAEVFQDKDVFSSMFDKGAIDGRSVMTIKMNAVAALRSTWTHFCLICFHELALDSPSSFSM